MEGSRAQNREAEKSGFRVYNWRSQLTVAAVGLSPGLKKSFKEKLTAEGNFSFKLSMVNRVKRNSSKIFIMLSYM